ncbi:MAG: hypothetical protein ACUVRM_10930 [Bacillota bacterium]
MDGSTWLMFADRTSNTAIGNPFYQDTGNVIARYIRITITGTQYSDNWVSIREFRVF